jgi:sulfur carrier protein ThiS adenylyltransferase
MSIFRDCSSGLAETLSSVTIGIAGAGGIGSNAAMLLVRAGASSIVVADFDSVEPWNLNRQFFFADQAGKPKVEALRENLLRINGDVCVEAHRMCLTPGNACGIFEKCDILIEAVDNSATKAFLIEEWSSVFPGKPIVACSGIAGTAPFSEIRTERTGILSVVGDHHSSLSQGTFSARVMAVASSMIMEVYTILSGGKCSVCKGCPQKETILVCDGERVQLKGFPARMVEGAVRGVVGSLKGVDPNGSIRIEMDQNRN